MKGILNDIAEIWDWNRFKILYNVAIGFGWAVGAGIGWYLTKKLLSRFDREADLDDQ